MMIKEWLKKQAERIEAEDATLTPKLFRRSYFHDYYEGYTEILEPSSNKKGFKIKRVYSANYYQQNMSKNKSITIRILYSILLLFSAVLLCYAAWLPVGCNFVWYSTLPQAASFAFVALSIWAMCCYITCGKNLKIRDYKQGSRALKRWSILSAVSLILTSLGGMLYCIIAYEYSFSLIICVMCYLLAAFAMLAINRVEASIEYLIISNPVDIGNVPAFQIDEL